MENKNTSRLTRAEGRRFALTLAAAFAVLAFLANWRDRERVAAGAWILATLMLAAGITIPSRLGPVERGWTKFGAAMSRITSPVFLGIVYFAVFTPAGVIRRIIGANPIVHKPVSDSYWKVREAADADIRRRSMERQF